MGGANNICSDKTGTLTKNQMTVTRFWGEGKIVDKFDKNDKTLSDNFKELLGWAVALNSDAQPKVRKAGFDQIGNKT
jgi:magnesium-transporting ATPase (P-type)